jgi:hypothetical protein
MYEFLLEPCILRCLTIGKKILIILQSEFILYFPCRVKNVFLTTLLQSLLLLG